MLADDYFLNEVDIKFVDITHGVQFQVEGNQQKAILRLAKQGAVIIPLLDVACPRKDGAGQVRWRAKDTAR